MTKKDIGLLRSLIREMVNEAPYREAPSVQLQQIRSPGLSVNVLAGAIGFSALAAGYSWLSNICSQAHTKFPIIQSDDKKDVLKAQVRSSPNLDDSTNTAWMDYKRSISLDKNIPIEVSDLSAAIRLYDLVYTTMTGGKNTPSWPKGTESWTGLRWDQRKKIRKELYDILILYTGTSCASNVNERLGPENDDAQLRQKFPLLTRTVYLQFLKDLMTNTRDTFKTGVEDQRRELTSVYSSGNNPKAIAGVCDASISRNQERYAASLRYVN